MASAFAHAVSAIAVKSLFQFPKASKKVTLLAVICSIWPDVDVIGFALGIDYGHWLGHRGFTHSLFFALLTGLLVSLLFFNEYTIKDKTFWKLVLIFSLSTASHGLLDAMTSGGKGIAFFAPFNNERYFLPWRPIKVSPIGIMRFISGRGARVLLNEAVWVGLPSLVIILLAKKYRKKKEYLRKFF